MAAIEWTKAVPDSETPLTARPLSWDQLVQQSIPVLKKIITTVAGGIAVSLPAAFTAEIDSADEYGVQFSKETFDPDGGEITIKPGTKTTSGFTVHNTGSTYGEKVMVTVWWIPPSA